MKVEEMVARFPEIPPALRGDPTLARYAERFGDLLSRAMPPSACQGTQQTAANAIYMKLVAPMKILGYGLSTPEKTLAKLRGLLEAHEADREQFELDLIPPEVATTPGGCHEG